VKPSPPPPPLPLPKRKAVPLPPGAINVRRFGARGDGVANDRAAIQAAVDTAHPGDTIYFPAGTYQVDDRIVFRKRRLTVRGDGIRSVIRHGNVTGFQLGTEGEPLTSLVISRLKFVGAPGKYKKDGAGGQAIQLFGPKKTLIEECDFFGPGCAVFNAGVVGTTYGTRILNCRVHGWGSVAIFCNGGEQILNCQLVQDDPDLNGERSSHGFYIHSGCTDVLVQDTLIQNARKYAAQVYGEQVGTTTARIQFRRVTVKDCANGLTIQQSQPSAARAQEVRIEGCTISGTYAGPALSVKQGDGIEILDNVIDGGSVGLQLGVWAPYEPGFSIVGLRASGNVIKNCGTGIWALASNGGKFENVTVLGNRISRCLRSVNLSGAPGVSYTP
jgi:hypothetical protein